MLANCSIPMLTTHDCLIVVIINIVDGDCRLVWHVLNGVGWVHFIAIAIQISSRTFSTFTDSTTQAVVVGWKHPCIRWDMISVRRVVLAQISIIALDAWHVCCYIGPALREVGPLAAHHVVARRARITLALIPHPITVGRLIGNSIKGRRPVVIDIQDGIIKGWLPLFVPSAIDIVQGNCPRLLGLWIGITKVDELLLDVNCHRLVGRVCYRIRTWHVFVRC